MTVGNGSRRNDPERIGARLREAREYLGFTRAAAETRADIPPTALSGIEDGQRGVGGAELARLAKLYRRPESGFASGDAPDRSLPPDIARLVDDMPNLSARDHVELATDRYGVRVDRQRRICIAKLGGHAHGVEIDTGETRA